MGFSRHECWSVSFPSPEDQSHPGIKPRFLALQADSLPSEPPGKPQSNILLPINIFNCRKSQHAWLNTTKFMVVTTFREEDRRWDPESSTWWAIPLCVCFICLMILKIWDKYENTLRWLEHPEIWMQPKFPSTYEWIRKMWYIYIIEYYSAIKRNEIMPFSATWLQPEIIILSKSERGRQRRNRRTNTT